MTVLYVYLGRKGGGAEFNRLIHEFVEKNSINEVLFLNSSVTQLEFEQKHGSSFSIFTPTKVAELPKHCLSLAHLLFKLFKVRSEFRTVVFLMASPWDLPILKFIKLLKKKVIFLVHDLEPHPGEKWPRKNSVASRINLSDNLVFLGDEVARQYSEHRNLTLRKQIVINHPAFFYANKQKQETAKVGDNSYILFIGRLAEYKGLRVLNDALLKLQDKNLKVIIAGEGQIEIKFPHNVKVINRWLEREEIIEYIRNAGAVIFPYIEASQSGLIPICMVMGKYLIISDVPGLVSQTRGYQNLSIFKAGDSQELSDLLAEVGINLPIGNAAVNNQGSPVLTEDEFASKLHEFALNCD